MKNEIVGYGELLLRLSPAVHGSLIEQSDALQMGFAGAEANIIADLALLGHNTSFVTALPGNPLGKKANQFLKSFGINTDAIVLDNGRIGSYYIEHGSSIRGTRVTYDRVASSVTKFIIPTDVWENMFTNATYFILTGVTPALSEICRKNILSALKVAQEKNVKVVFDLNYRRTLWGIEDARKSFESILPFVNILIANTGSAYDVFGIDSSAYTDYKSAKNATQDVTESLSKKGNFDCVGMTIRLQNTASDNELGGMIKKGKEYSFSNSIQTNIVDRLGGGDAFAAAFLHGVINNWSSEKTVNFATAAFAVTQTIQGDINLITELEMLAIAEGNKSGFVQR